MSFIQIDDLVASQLTAVEFLNILLSKIGRMDSSERFMITVDAGTLPAVTTVGTVTAVTTVGTVTNTTNLNNFSGGNTNHIPRNMAQMGCIHIYNQIIVT